MISDYIFMSDSVPNKASRRFYSFSIIVFLIVFALGLSASYAWQLQQTKVKRTHAVSVAQSYAYQLKQVLDHNLSANYTLAALVHEFGGFTRWFPPVAQSLHRIYPEVNNFALSPGGIVKQVYPTKGNERAIGFNQLMDIEQGTEAWLAMKQQKTILSGPLDLVQGGKGLIARYPIMLEDRDEGPEQFWGFSSVVIRIDSLLKSTHQIGLSEQGFAYSLQRVDTNEPLLIVEDKAEQINDPVSINLSFPGVKWRLDIAPADGWIPTYMLVTYLLASFVLALLVARFAFMALRLREQKQMLTHLLSEKTKYANQSDYRLSSTLQAIPDPLIELDADGVVLEVRLPNDETDLQAFFVSGEHFSAHLPESAAQILELVFSEAGQSQTNSYRGALFSLLLSEGRTLWFEVSAVYRPFSEEVSTGHFIVLLRDISQRQEAEQQQRIAATAFETQDGILISDRQNRIIRVNKAFQKLTGYTENEVLGQTPAILQSGRHSPEFYQDMFADLRQKGAWEGEVWNRRKDGEIYPEWLSISTVHDLQGQVSHFVATFKDISERKASERKIQQLHYYDSLTRLANRTLLLEEMNDLLQNNGLQQSQAAILFIDLDHFKDINDVWGHSIGDQLLQKVATRLSDTTRTKDIVARFGGDEFLVMLESADVSANPDRMAYRASQVAGKLLRSLERPFTINSVDYQMAASFGIALFDDQCNDPLDVIKQAELAMYEAKSAGRSSFCFYQQGMQERVLERVQLESDLRHALENEELVVYVQPQWDAQKRMIGAEGLLRWLHPERGMVSPGVFIPLAEESRLILPIGDWVLRQACRWLSKWQKEQQMAGFVLSVNVSAVQFAQEGFVQQVESILNEYQTPPSALQLELTESMLAHDQQDIISKMEALKALGLLISLDDFGTGYSSLSYLHRLPIDQLKIDQSFVANIEKGTKNASLAESIISLGHNLGMEVIAEGVETSAQFDWLKEQGCDLFQGFGLARPMTIEDLIVLYRSAD